MKLYIERSYGRKCESKEMATKGRMKRAMSKEKEEKRDMREARWDELFNKYVYK